MRTLRRVRTLREMRCSQKVEFLKNANSEGFQGRPVVLGGPNSYIFGPIGALGGPKSTKIGQNQLLSLFMELIQNDNFEVRYRDFEGFSYQTVYLGYQAPYFGQTYRKNRLNKDNRESSVPPPQLGILQKIDFLAATLLRKVLKMRILRDFDASQFFYLSSSFPIIFGLIGFLGGPKSTKIGQNRLLSLFGPIYGMSSK